MQEVLPYPVLQGLSSTSTHTACLPRQSSHSFLNDTMPGRYRAAQTEAAWSQMLFFLDTVLNKGWNKERVIWRLESDTSVHYDFSTNRRWE